MTARQLAAQLRKEVASLKRDQVSACLVAVLGLLHDSQLNGSALWPKHGFLTGGYRGEERNDTITIGINIVPQSEYKKVRFNIWGRKPRVLKQRKQLVLIFDQAFYEGIFFTPEYPEYIDQLSYHDHGNIIMDMVDFRFTFTE